MARIYTVCGMYDEALDELDYLFSLQTDNTVNELKFWYWVDPLRDNPRYQELLERYAISPPA